MMNIDPSYMDAVSYSTKVIKSKQITTNFTSLWGYSWLYPIVQK